MQFKTHLLFGLFLGLFTLPILNPANSILFVCLVLLGSAMPDIDHPNSKMGRLFKPIGWLFEHRGFFHSIFPVLLLLLLTKLYSPLFLPFAIGYISHILIDMTTKQGILLIHPIVNVKVSGFIKTGGILEWFVFMILILANIYLIISL